MYLVPELGFTKDGSHACFDFNFAMLTVSIVASLADKWRATVGSFFLR